MDYGLIGTRIISTILDRRPGTSLKIYGQVLVFIIKMLINIILLIWTSK